jgi:hypothetical protein
MDIKVTDAKDNTGEGGDGTKSITVDITPMIQTVATTESDTSKIVTEGKGVNAVVLGEAEHLKVTGTVQVDIPLPADFVTFAQGAETATLYVRHTTESGRVYTYQGTVDAATHVLTFDNPHGFSSFEIGTQAAVATNGNIGYDNLKEAVEEAKDGDTITISADNTEKITVTKTISFTIAGGYTTKIKAGAYTTLTKTDVEVGTLYTFVYTAPTYSDKDDKDDADTTETPSFTDVPEGQWYSDAVAYCAANGLMDGVGDGKFEPRTTVSRAMAITTLYRMAGSPEVTGSNNFTDLTQDWYKDAVQWGVTVGITDGVSATSFAPDDDISREQLATMLYRYANVMGLDVSNKNDLSGYTDSGEISSFATEAMQWANAAGYVTGNSATTLAPKAVSDRATLATILMRYCESNAAE